MAYKTVFMAMTAFEGASPALDYAVDLVGSQDGHLEIMCLGLERAQTAYYEMGANAMILQAAIEESHRKADAVREGVTAYLEKAGVRWDAVSSVGAMSGVGRTLAARARFADLAVVDLPYAQEQPGTAGLILDGLLFDADCPTLAVPPGKFSVRPESIVIGWNESTEAMRAIRKAMPFLLAADNVHIAIIDPPEHGPERSDPGGSLAVFLARHGVASDIQVMSRSGGRVSERLAQHVTETGSELLVMGGYGHSRFREAILGGATRDMLEHAKVPILMAH